MFLDHFLNVIIYNLCKCEKCILSISLSTFEVMLENHLGCDGIEDFQLSAFVMITVLGDKFSKSSDCFKGKMTN